MTKDWICKRCFHAASTKSNLLSHLRNKKPCSVDIDEGGVDIPIKTYIDELLVPKQPKKYACPHCNSRFGYNQSMNKHIKSCKDNPMNAKDANDSKTKIEDMSNNTDTQNEVSNLQQTIDEQRQLIHFLRKENEILLSSQVQVVLKIDSSNPTISNLQKYRKKKISHTVKISCWNAHVGESIAKTKCMCCQNVDITQHNFHCGHIVAESNGGSCEINNLLPICNVCNASMGCMNMNEFRTTYGLVKL